MIETSAERNERSRNSVYLVSVAGGWPATIPSFIPTASLEGARGTVAGSPLEVETK